jgi:hypothetical protein
MGRSRRAPRFGFQNNGAPRLEPSPALPKRRQTKTATREVYSRLTAPSQPGLQGMA